MLFNRLFDRFQPGLLGLACRLLNNRTEAEDVIAETFVKLWQTTARFGNPEAVGGWLRVTIRNQCLNLIKQRQQQLNRMQQLYILQDKEEDDIRQEELLAALLEEVYAAVRSLPDKSKEVFTLRYFEGLKNEEIAVRLGIRNQSVRNHLSTALRQLRLLFMDRPDILSLIIALWGSPLHLS